MKKFALTTAAAVAVSLAAPALASDKNLDIRVSLILDGIYFNELKQGNHSPAGFGGDHHHHDNGDNHSHGLAEGFNLGHSELAFEASLGDLLDGMLMLGFDSNHIEVEEAYLKTRSLPAGFQLKVGKFLSGIGYINSRHSHDWDFVDRPLVNEYLFGDHGLQEIGIQTTWLAPRDSYTLVGVELLQGENPEVANYIGEQEALDGTNRILKDRSGPRLLTAFTKWAPDLGHDHALQLGASAGYSFSYQYTSEHSTRHEDWDGKAWFAGLDAVYKYETGRSHGHGNLTLQAEYFYREIDVDRRDVNFAADSHGPVGHIRNVSSFKNKQDGLYAQGVYGFAPRWEAGLRAEALGLTNELGRGDGTNHDTSYRYSGQVTFRPTEPVFLRAQLNHNDFAGDDGRSDKGWEFMLQVNVALGAHGAHTF
ncbi:hypothetical protein [Desulfurivibrio alkaliphilus]|uniref:Zinc-regulated TonB-dependent outer membrane receptor n=1 Tax=Desulfurivibrio alkaliphilus (strain DSM 19089 / UNIQEM U267 / AHT2) TaxID=589865 RepID=D6Z140_DESAT|nr:hypothetical protein [Desulfurivibrio alkaliphilus]ADH87300.1 conserved hypothetical protein [Desulfurivibrio alkaliphilus AHT 2]